MRFDALLVGLVSIGAFAAEPARCAAAEGSEHDSAVAEPEVKRAVLVLEPAVPVEAIATKVYVDGYELGPDDYGRDIPGPRKILVVRAFEADGTSFIDDLVKPLKLDGRTVERLPTPVTYYARTEWAVAMGVAGLVAAGFIGSGINNYLERPESTTDHVTFLALGGVAAAASIALAIPAFLPERAWKLAPVVR